MRRFQDDGTGDGGSNLNSGNSDIAQERDTQLNQDQDSSLDGGSDQQISDG